MRIRYITFINRIDIIGRRLVFFTQLMLVPIVLEVMIAFWLYHS